MSTTIYTKTSLADVAITSELKDLGWTVDGGGKEYYAHEKAGELRSIGPAASVKALHTQVMRAAGEPVSGNGSGKTVAVGSSTLEGGAFTENSQPILTGTEDAVFEDMATAGRDYRRTTMEILRLQKTQKTEHDTLEKLMAKFKDELEFDPDTNERFFTVDVEGESVDIVDETVETHKIKTRKS